jgi:hypothetical protein
MCSITGSNLALSSEKKTYVTFDSMHPADHVDINLGRQFLKAVFRIRKRSSGSGSGWLINYISGRIRILQGLFSGL